MRSELLLVSGWCPCGHPGEYLVWSKDGRIGTFVCAMHLAAVKKRFGGGGLERMD